MRLIRMLLLPALALTAVSAHADPASVASLKNLLDKSQSRFRALADGTTQNPGGFQTLQCDLCEPVQQCATTDDRGVVDAR